MFAALFLAPELFHFYGETNFFRWATKIGDFFKVVSHLHENCGSAAFWAGLQEGLPYNDQAGCEEEQAR